MRNQLKLQHIYHISCSILNKNSVNNGHYISKEIIKYILDISEKRFLLYLNYPISKEKQHDIFYNIKLIAIEKKPLEYITGRVSFLGNIIYVNEDVLIPRIETEELVIKSIDFIERLKLKDKKIVFADIGTGSGAIAISLFKYLAKKNLFIDSYAIDISKAALKKAEFNIKKNNCNIKCLEGNLIDPLIEKNIKIDFLICNPPYISYNEKIQESVYKYEPHIALFSENKGLKCYIEIFKKLDKIIKDEFLAAFEIGSTQGKILIDLANKYLNKDKKIFLERDLQDRYRILFIYNFI